MGIASPSTISRTLGSRIYSDGADRRKTRRQGLVEALLEPGPEPQVAARGSVAPARIAVDRGCLDPGS